MSVFCQRKALKKCESGRRTGWKAKKYIKYCGKWWKWRRENSANINLSKIKKENERRKKAGVFRKPQSLVKMTNGATHRREEEEEKIWRAILPAFSHRSNCQKYEEKRRKLTYGGESARRPAKKRGVTAHATAAKREALAARKGASETLWKPYYGYGGHYWRKLQKLRSWHLEAAKLARSATACRKPKKAAKKRTLLKKAAEAITQPAMLEGRREAIFQAFNLSES